MFSCELRQVSTSLIVHGFSRFLSVCQVVWSGISINILLSILENKID